VDVPALGLVLLVLLPPLLQAAARAATATLSADTRSRAFLCVLLITGFDPPRVGRDVSGPPGAGPAERRRGGCHMDVEWTVSSRDLDHKEAG